MLYSKTAKYAVLALAEAALCTQGEPISTRQIAAASSVPYPLLAKIVGQLRRVGLVRSTRGKNGGILLTRPAAEITIQEVVIALDGPDVLNDCPLFLAPCSCDRECSMHSLWKPARDAVARFFERTTIQEIAEARLEAKESCNPQV